MDIDIIQRVRIARQSERFTLIAQEITGGLVDSDCLYVAVIEVALHQMEKVFFTLGSGYHLNLTPINSKGDNLYERVVVSETEDGCVVKKEEVGYPAYEFLKDYLGLDKEIPYSMGEIVGKYPNIQRDFHEAFATNEERYDNVAFSLLESIRKRIRSSNLDTTKFGSAISN